MTAILKVFLATLSVAALAQGVSFVAVSNRFITPNGATNNTVEFEFNNLGRVQVIGKIFDLRGAHVADMTADCPDLPSFECLRWDGTSGGRSVNGGVYIYGLQAQGWSYNGTIVVIK